MAIRIYIDQGHNPRNPNAGAEGNGLREQDLVYPIGVQLAERLNANPEFEARLSRPTPSTQIGNSNSESLRLRVQDANAWGADYFISLHTNAAEASAATGSEGFAFSRPSAAFLLGIQILNRPRYTASTEPQIAVITEIPHSEAVPVVPKTQSAEPEEEVQEEVSSLRGKTSTKVNIRELPSQDARVLETVEAGTEYDIIEILDSGWVKIQYTEDIEAYISASYVILIP